MHHPQKDGLIGKFNQTLKRMHRRVVEEDGRNWDFLLPYVLFPIWETPQATTNFTPFEILLGKRPQALLDIAKEACERQSSLFQMAFEYVKEMQEQID